MISNNSKTKRLKTRCSQNNAIIQIYTGSDGNIMASHIFKILFPWPTKEQLATKKQGGHPINL